MQTQTTICLYLKAIKALELLTRVNDIIKDSEKYAYSGSMFNPVVLYHIQTIEKYRKVRDRLVKYYCNVRFRAYNTSLPEVTSITDNLLPF